MLVRRSDVSVRVSIQRESCTTGANAMSSSFAGKGAPSAFDRTKRSRCGERARPGSIGFHTDAGASVSPSATARGPVRRSRYGASERRQVSAACWRSAGVSVTCISFSASANVAVVTSGPAPVPVPKVGGAPGVAGVPAGAASEAFRSPAHAAAETRMPSGALIRNWRLVFMREWYDYSRAMRTLLLATLTLLYLPPAQAPGIPLTPGIVIDRSTRIRPGVYRLPSAAIDRPAVVIRGNDIRVDMAGVTIEGGAPF